MWTRWTVCLLLGHKWNKVPYPPDPTDGPTGHFIRCHRCARENHEASSGWTKVVSTPVPLG